MKKVFAKMIMLYERSFQKLFLAELEEFSLEFRIPLKKYLSNEQRLYERCISFSFLSLFFPNKNQSQFVSTGFSFSNLFFILWS